MLESVFTGGSGMARQPVTVEAIRRAVSRGEGELSVHTLERMYKRDIDAETLLAVLAEGEILERYDTAEHGPSALVLGYTEHGG